MRLVMMIFSLFMSMLKRVHSAAICTILKIRVRSRQLLIYCKTSLFLLQKYLSKISSGIIGSTDQNFLFNDEKA